MQFSVKPVFIALLAFLAQLPIQLFFTVWCGGFFGGLLTASQLFPKNSFLPFAIPGICGFALVFFFGFIVKKVNYARTEYRFYDDRVEFEEGFFTINKKTVRYKDMREVTLRKGLFQRMYGLGTVYLATLATGSTPYNNSFQALGFGNISASGISIRDVKEPDALYEKIRAIVDQHS